MHSIKQLCDEIGISRSSLLYYERMGLLTPSARSAANYRLYNEGDKQRLGRIMLYRQLGVPVKELAPLLDDEPHQGQALLEKQLERMNAEIEALKQKQQELVRLLQRDEWHNSPKLDKQAWSLMLANSGLDEDGMRHWHMEFETRFPQEHENFLIELGISETERKEIRGWGK